MPPGGEDRFFPLELLELMTEEEDDGKLWMDNLFKEITVKEDTESTLDDADNIKVEEDEMDIGRSECSQDKYYSIW